MVDAKKLQACVIAMGLAIAIAGCGEEPQSPANEADDSGSLAAHYMIVSRDGKNVPHAGIQHRYVHVVLRDPTNRKLAKRVLKEIYDSCKADIEATQPEAQHKRIHVRLFDSAEDAEDGYGSPICWVFSSGWAGPVLPEFEKAKIDWNWRDQRSRPTAEEIAIYREYRRGRERITENVEAPYYDSHGIKQVSLDDVMEIDAQVKLATFDLVAAMCQRHGVTKAQLARLIAYVWEWIEGRDTSDARIDDAAALQFERWTP